MQIKSHNRLNKDAGNVVLITTILLLVMTIVVAATINLSGMQFDLSLFERNTSNTYYLAKSAVETQVDMMNKAIQSDMTHVVKEFNNTYIAAPLTLADSDKQKLASLNPTATATQPYLHLIYEGGKLKVTGATLTLRDAIEGSAFTLIESKFANKEYIYQVKSDKQAGSNIVTEVVVKVECIEVLPALITPAYRKDIYKVTATATSKDGANVFDTQTVEAEIKLDIPNPIENEVREKYEWVGNPPEILSSAIVCFTDMVVTSDASLTVYGDIRVKGTRAVTVTSANYWPDADESGGLIVSNGGKLEVKRTTSAATTVTSGNIYSMNNVATTNGFTTEPSLGSHFYHDKDTWINVEGDIIANTVGIFDDYYSGAINQEPLGDDAAIGAKVRNNNITASNIFVDNDVKIDKWVGLSNIKARGSMLGISNNGITETNDDPNSSSGVFNRGYSTTIEADQMFVHGQPFIVFRSNGPPSRLHESIGEPFDALAAWGIYTSESNLTTYLAGDPSYLDPDSPFKDDIKRDGIIINEVRSKLFASAAISAKVAGAVGATTSGPGLMLNPTYAKELFFVGGYTTAPNFITNQYEALDLKYYIFEGKSESRNYYKGNIGLWKDAGMYKKFYTPIPNSTPALDDPHLFYGLRAYMTAMRSVFYGRFQSNPTDPMYSYPEDLDFGDVVSLPTISEPWSYSNPIVTTTSGNIDISQYYITEGGSPEPHPTIILNKSSSTLTITASEPTKNKFKGIIISERDILLNTNIVIEGSIIVGGTGTTVPADRQKIMVGNSDSSYKPGLKIASNGVINVQIIHNPNILLEMNFANPANLRQVLDGLKITQYGNPLSDTNIAAGSVKHILGPYNYNVTNATPTNLGVPLSYTMGSTVLKNTSVLDIRTEQISLSIKNMKKIY